MINPFDLKGKVALVTGGNGGIGLGMASALAEAGADVVIWGTNAAKNESAVQALRAKGVRCSSTVIDVANEQAVVVSFAAAVKEMGRVDTVFANAGIGGKPTKFIEATGELLKRVLDVNTAGVFYTFREACRHMVERAAGGDPGGSLVAIGTVGTESGMPRYQSYASSKGALAPMMRAIVAEHSRHKIRVNVLHPGYIETDMTTQWTLDEGTSNSIVQTIPLRRWGRPEDFGGMAVYLASDASSYHTGNTIVIDGGYLSH